MSFSFIFLGAKNYPNKKLSVLDVELHYHCAAPAAIDGEDGPEQLPLENKRRL